MSSASDQTSRAGFAPLEFQCAESERSVEHLTVMHLFGCVEYKQDGLDRPPAGRRLRTAHADRAVPRHYGEGAEVFGRAAALAER